jgi:hypothetical protein
MCCASSISICDQCDVICTFLTTHFWSNMVADVVIVVIVVMCGVLYTARRG